MLSVSRRLRLKRDFERVFIDQRSVSGRFFRLKTASAKGSPTRFAVVVSGKVHKRAVVRNRIRRRAWSVIAEWADKLPSGHDVVFIAQPPAARSTFTDVKSDIAFLFTKYFRVS